MLVSACESRSGASAPQVTLTTSARAIRCAARRCARPGDGRRRRADTLEQVQIEFAGQRFADRDAADAVAVLVQQRREDGDAELAGEDADDAAAHDHLRKKLSGLTMLPVQGKESSPTAARTTNR